MNSKTPRTHSSNCSRISSDAATQHTNRTRSPLSATQTNRSMDLEVLRLASCFHSLRNSVHNNSCSPLPGVIVVASWIWPITLHNHSVNRPMQGRSSLSCKLVLELRVGE